MKQKKPELIFLTQSLEPDRKSLGFTHDWIDSLRNNFDVITISQDGLHIQSIDERKYVIGNNGKINKIINFVILVNRLSRKNDGLIIFVHMIPIYALILLALKKIIKFKKIYLWFAHKNKPFYFNYLDKHLDGIFTTSKHVLSDEYKNVKYLGHGISSDRFSKNYIYKKTILKVDFIYVGRIAKIKNIHYMLILLNELSKILTQKKISFMIVGSPITKKDEEYYRYLSKFAENLDGNLDYKFVGEVSFNRVQEYYGESSFGINASPRGAMDKAPIEGIFAGAPFFYINEAYNELHERSHYLRDRMQITGNLHQDAMKVMDVINLGDQYIDEASSQLISAAHDMFSLENFFQKLNIAIN